MVSGVHCVSEPKDSQGQIGVKENTISLLRIHRVGHICILNDEDINKMFSLKGVSLCSPTTGEYSLEKE